MQDLENAVLDAVDRGVVPGAVVCAKDKTGSFDYSRSLAAKDGLYKSNTVISIASLTKLVTSIAVLQLVEKGLISLDEDVAELIPSLASQVVLDGFDTNGQPLTHARRNMITVRRLLTHSAGASYHFTDPRIQQVQALRSVQDESTAGTVERNFSYPLSYEPGEGFMYSSSLDWAGQIVEKVSRLGLEDYFQKYIFKPLRITTGTFWSTDHAPMSVRPAPDEPVETKHGSWNFATGWTECSGGQGLFMSMEDYVKILHSLLLDDEILLKSETAAELFRPCLSVASNAELSKRMETPNWLVGDFSGPTKYDWSLGGLLVDGDDHEYRRRNAVMWSAASSCFWFIDRDAGVCGVFGTQVLPPADPRVKPLIELFERSVYGWKKSLAHDHASV